MKKIFKTMACAMACAVIASCGGAAQKSAAKEEANPNTIVLDRKSVV